MSPKETHDDYIKTLGDESPFYITVRKGGKKRMEDYEQSGCPKETITNENIEIVHSMIMCNRRSLCDIARQTGTRFGTVSIS